MMKAQSFFLSALLWLICQSVFAQISGVITDLRTGDLLDNVTVFVNKTTLSASSNAIGEFTINGIRPGIAELIVYKNGYQIFKSPVQIKDGHAIRIPLQLNPDRKVIVTNTLKSNKERTSYFHLLEQSLLGSGQDVFHCKIMNEASLIFSKSGDTIKLSSTEPIKIANPYTGYEMRLYPNPVDPDIRHILANVMLRFDTLLPLDDRQLKDWNRNRENYFLGSGRHFFSSLVRQLSAQQGFTLMNEKGDTLNPATLIVPVKVSGYTVIRLKGKTKIVYSSQGIGQKISWVNTPDDFSVNDEGILLNDKSADFSGDMKVAAIARWVPLNFYPFAAIRTTTELPAVIRLFQEKVYVQTDKPYYYPGEMMWLKGYLNYVEHDMRDSLSRVLYVELIDPKNRIVFTRILKIDSGMVWGNFVVPESLHSGNYQLRAYTNLMMNFNHENIFRKAVPILNEKDRVDNDNGKESVFSSAGLTLKSDKPTYKLREGIKLSMSVVDEDQEPVFANLSISVTDAVQVVPIPETVSIISNYSFANDTKKNNLTFLQYPVERGISFTGQFLNDHGQKQQTSLTFLQGGLQNMFLLKTGSDGLFQQSGYQFYDSLTFSYEAKNGKGIPYGTVNILPREIIPVTSIDSLNLKIIHTEIKQRVLGEEEVTNGPKTLRQVNFTSSKFEETKFIAQTYGMGQRNRIFKGELFKGNDMAEALAMGIPTLKMFSISAGRFLSFQMNNPLWIISNRTYVRAQPVLLPREPLIYYNDSYIGGGAQPAVSALSIITPSTVDHVEVIYGVPYNRLIDIQGGYGLIAIYTKPNSFAKGFKKLTIPGYTRPHQFIAPEYDSQNESTGLRDFRSTIYWNPNVIVEPSPDPTTISFYAADLPGKYRVVAEGVTGKGVPVRAEFYFEVKE
jgi:hypothetical protein